jgi:DNA polymerase III alpha subunit
MEGFYYYPRLTAFPAQHAEGLIAPPAVWRRIYRAHPGKGEDAARKKLDWYYDVFGADNFFMELRSITFLSWNTY